jgi:hypothetical protein
MRPGEASMWLVEKVNWTGQRAAHWGGKRALRLRVAGNECTDSVFPEHQCALGGSHQVLFLAPLESRSRVLTFRRGALVANCSWLPRRGALHWPRLKARERINAETRFIGNVLRGALSPRTGNDGTFRDKASSGALTLQSCKPIPTPVGLSLIASLRAWTLVALGFCALGTGLCWAPRRVSARPREQALNASVIQQAASKQDTRIDSSTTKDVSGPLGQRLVASVSVPAQSDPSVIDLGKLGYALSDFVDMKKLFAPELAERTETQMELEEIEDDEVQKATVLTVRRVVQSIGAVVATYLVYIGSRRWEEWMREEERLATEQEISLTGTYIDPAVPREDLEKRRGSDSTSTSSSITLDDDESGRDSGPDTAAGNPRRPGSGPKPSAPGSDRGGSSSSSSSSTGSPSRDRSPSPDEGLDLLDDLLD